MTSQNLIFLLIVVILWAVAWQFAHSKSDKLSFWAQVDFLFELGFSILE